MVPLPVFNTIRKEYAGVMITGQTDLIASAVFAMYQTGYSTNETSVELQSTNTLNSYSSQYSCTEYNSN